MDNKDLVHLLLREIKEMSLLCASLSELDDIPNGLLCLSREKVDSMSIILDRLQGKNQEVKRGVEEKIEVCEEKKCESVAKESVSMKDNVQLTKALEEKENQEEEKTQKKCKVEEKKEDFGTKIVENKVEKETKEEIRKDMNQESPKEIVGAQESVVCPTKEKKTEKAVSTRVPSKSISAESRFVKSLKLCLGDKFRYKKELFGDDMSLLNKTMAELDALSSMEEAFAYIERFDWDEENPAVEDFLNLLQNRFS